MEDEWEREIDSDEDLDLLFVTYQAEKITLDQLVAAIKEHGFTAEVREGIVE